MTQEVADMLQMLADRYGTTVESLVSEMAGREIINSYIIVAICAAILMAIIYGTKNIGKKLYDIDQISFYVLASFCGIVAFFVLIWNITNIVSWTVAPSATMIERILSLIGGK